MYYDEVVTVIYCSSGLYLTGVSKWITSVIYFINSLRAWPDSVFSRKSQKLLNGSLWNSHTLSWAPLGVHRFFFQNDMSIFSPSTDTFISPIVMIGDYCLRAFSDRAHDYTRVRSGVRTTCDVNLRRVRYRHAWGIEITDSLCIEVGSLNFLNFESILAFATKCPQL